MSIKVTLRQKPMSKNRQNLYLDIYPPIINAETGELTRRKFLGKFLYIDKEELKKKITFLENKKYEKNSKEEFELQKLKETFKKYKNLKPLTVIEKTHNSESLRFAEAVKQNLQNQLDKPEIYSGYEIEKLELKARGEKNFIEYFKTLADKRKASNHDNWVSAYNYLNAYTNGYLPCKNLNEKFCNNFKEYLQTTKSKKSNKVSLSQNSAFSYFNKFKASLKQAYKDKYLSTDLNSIIEPIQQAETRRNFLTIEELNQLIKTECNNPLLKRAALFSAMTGLRHIDIIQLEWGQIDYSKQLGYRIDYTQQKTKGIEYYPISKQAFSLLGEKKEPKALIFEGLNYSAYENKHLAKWIGLAGIEKDITFHCFRHTFATLQLSKGTDIYTVSKMLGHKDLKTTQIYAKIIDETKRKAANKIKLDL